MNTAKKVNRAPYAAVGLVQMLALGSMYAWTFFKVNLVKDFPSWTTAQVNLNFTIMMCLFCLGGVLAGKISQWVPKQVQVLISAALLFAGFLGVSFLPTGNPELALILLYVCYGGLTGLGTGIAYNAVQTSIQPWFPDRTGLMSGLLLMSMGFGTLIMGNVAGALMKVISVFSTFRVFAVVDLAIFAGLSGFIHAPGPDVALPAAPASRQTASAMDIGPGQMAKRATFWIYFFWNICCSSSGMIVVNYASDICAFYGLAAAVGLFVSVFNGFGRLLTGIAVDRFGWKATMFGINGVLIASGLLMFFGGQAMATPVVLVGMLLMGIVYGSGITLSATMIRQLYGNTHYAQNFSVCNLCTFPAAIIGPMLSAALIQAAGGGYQTTFLMVIILGALTLVMNFFIRKP
ncbi:MAG: MFS transporter [Oscillospiraceae bacterium]|nr:MFS transporter [Oscillospiraceae bacterium]